MTGVFCAFLGDYELALLLVEGDAGGVEVYFTAFAEEGADVGVLVCEVVEVDFVVAL